MSRPNYSYCAEYCDGKLPNCPHYDGKFGMKCITYKDLKKLKEYDDVLDDIGLEKLIQLAGKQF